MQLFISCCHKPIVFIRQPCCYVTLKLKDLQFRMLFIFSRSIAAWCRPHFKTLDQGWQNYWKRKEFLDTRHSLLSEFFIVFARPTSLHFEEYVHICIYLTANRLLNNCRCYQTILRLKHFYTNRERCEMLTGYLSRERQPWDEWANRWHIFCFWRISSTVG
jgi:hypothetical protein